MAVYKARKTAKQKDSQKKPFESEAEALQAVREHLDTRWRRGDPTLKESWKTLAPHLIEEISELLLALRGGREEEIRSEMGDVLYVAMYGVRLAHTPRPKEIDGEFDVHGNPTKFPKGDWRRGKSGMQLCSELSDSDPDFLRWLEANKESIMLGADATKRETHLLHKILYIHREVFARNPKCPNLIKGVEHVIRLKHGVDIKPVKQRLYRMSPGMLKAEAEETKVAA